MTEDPALLTSAEWRPLQRGRPRRGGVGGIVVFMIGVVLLGLCLNASQSPGGLQHILIALGLLLGGMIGAAATLVLLPPVSVAAPPAAFHEAAQLDWARRPDIGYPWIAYARRQCGWVALRVSVDAQGLVQSYQIAAQAPGRTFEAEAARALAGGELPPDAAASGPREVKALITFVRPGPKTPPWALERLEAHPKAAGRD
jgi:TonB family protein